MAIEMAFRPYKFCGQSHEGPVTARPYVVGPDTWLGNCFVYIKEGAKPTPATGAEPVLDQKGCMYEPYVIGAVTNQKIKIQNSAPTMHNIHATPKNNPRQEFNL